ncbi:MAG: DUF2096 family protein [Candidatus Thorarchaeota archaeon]|nr:DUF2096 family protein [Candidatus Thorarchaeota archaeon]
MVSLEGLSAGWMVINELLGELREKGAFIPDLTYADMRNTKMSLEYLRSFGAEMGTTDEEDSRLREEMEHRMLLLRDTVMMWAEQQGGPDYRRRWQESFDRAVRGEIPPPEEARSIPITDLPRDKDVGFFRIRLLEDIPVEVISEIAEDCRVNISLDGDRHLQVSGKRECVRQAMTRLGRLFYGESRVK